MNDLLHAVEFRGIKGEDLSGADLHASVFDHQLG